MKEKNQPRKYRRYDDEFKKNAVKMVENGRTISDVSKALGINGQSLYDWKKKYDKSVSKDDKVEQELKEVRKKLKEVEQERDILKKALSIFSRQI